MEYRGHESTLHTKAYIRCLTESLIVINAAPIKYASSGTVTVPVLAAPGQPAMPI